MKPDILLLGQITIDDAVPALPGPWQKRLGGNALYSLAGARLWCQPERLGVVTRIPDRLFFDLPQLFERVGLSTDGLRPSPIEPLVEWILYEEDGNRQSMPRNPALRDPAADAATLYDRYLTHLAGISPSAEDIPASWLPAHAVHLSPQVAARHTKTCNFLEGKTKHLSVDPSPHYSRGATAQELRRLLPGATAFLPSQAEIEHMQMTDGSWSGVLHELCLGGFSEVLLKRGAQGCLVLAETSEVRKLPAAEADVSDLTGAGDAFSGAYLANRALGHTPLEAACRAAVTAAMVIECSGAQAALRLSPQEAKRRLDIYKQRIALED